MENIIPYIGGEEEKSEKEPLRVLGTLENGEIKLAEEPKITCQCLRVPVLNGHTAAVFINFEKKPTKGTADRETGKLQGIPTGSRTSKCSKAVHPVPVRRRQTAGKSRC